MSLLPPPPAGQQWITFADGSVAFLAPSDFSTHQEADNTVAVYPPGDSGITLRFSLHTRALQPDAPANAAEQFVTQYAATRNLEITRLPDRVYLTESQEAGWPDRRVLMHNWQIGYGRILVVASATIWGSDRQTPTVRDTLSLIPQIIESFTLHDDT